MSRRVSFADCKFALVDRAGPPASDALLEWRARPDRREVVSFVEGFTHEVLFTLTSDDVKRVIAETNHALGTIEKEQQILEVENFTAPFAFQHVFHGFIESCGYLPTWQDFRGYLQKAARHQWLDYIEPLKADLRKAYDDNRISNAIQWRLGKAYYSSIREIDFLVSMNERGFPLNYHLLADVLLRSDFWLESIILSVRVPNKYERRKSHAQQYLGHAKPPFKFVDCEVTRQRFGKLWLTSEESKDEIAQRMAAAAAA